MQINDIEKQIRSLRIEQQIKFKDLQIHGVSRSKVDNIESGRNYKIGSLFRYLERLAMYLVVDGETIEDIESFGKFLANKRVSMKILTDDIKHKVKLNPQQISSIENGREYTKESLLKYIEVVNVDFDLISMSKVFGL